MEIAQKFDKMRRDVKYPSSIDLDRDAKRKVVAIYNTQIRVIDQLFKLALFEGYGLPTHNRVLPTLFNKAEKAFSIAWEHGHSSGYNGVEMYFSALVEVIK